MRPLQMKLANPKSQVPSSNALPNPKSHANWRLEVGSALGFGAWSLGFDPSRITLKHVFHHQLHDPRIVDSARDGAKRRALDVRLRRSEVRMIEHVEELAANEHVMRSERRHPLADREVGIPEARRAQDADSGIAEFTERGRAEGRAIDPLLERRMVHFSAADPVGPLSRAGGLKRRRRAVEHGDGVSTVRDDTELDRPATGHAVERTVPVAAEA